MGIELRNLLIVKPRSERSEIIVKLAPFPIPRFPFPIPHSQLIK